MVYLIVTNDIDDTSYELRIPAEPRFLEAVANKLSGMIEKETWHPSELNSFFTYDDMKELKRRLIRDHFQTKGLEVVKGGE